MSDDTYTRQTTAISFYDFNTSAIDWCYCERLWHIRFMHAPTMNTIYRMCNVDHQRSRYTHNNCHITDHLSFSASPRVHFNRHSIQLTCAIVKSRTQSMMNAAITPNCTEIKIKTNLETCQTHNTSNLFVLRREKSIKINKLLSDARECT